MLGTKKVNLCLSLMISLLTPSSVSDRLFNTLMRTDVKALKFDDSVRSPATIYGVLVNADGGKIFPRPTVLQISCMKNRGSVEYSSSSRASYSDVLGT